MTVMRYWLWLLHGSEAVSDVGVVIVAEDVAVGS